MEQLPLVVRFDRWRSGLGEEVKFWDNWLKTRGADWPDDFNSRSDPDGNFPEYLARFVPRRGARVLDVGAGPMTSVGRMHNGFAVNLIACDPLAPIYDRLSRSSGVDRPVMTQQAFAEDLSAFFEADSFDLVYCQNALDHSFEPLRGIEEMLIVAKKGGYIFLTHSTNEAEHENYSGLHQWNFDSENGKFIIWNKETRIDVSAHISPIASSTVIQNGRSHVVILQKRKRWPHDRTQRMRERISHILSGLLHEQQSDE